MKMDKPALDEPNTLTINQGSPKIPRSLLRTPPLPYLIDIQALRYKSALDLGEREFWVKSYKLRSNVLMQKMLKEILSFKKVHNWKNSSELLITVKKNCFIYAETWELLGKLLAKHFSALKRLELQFDDEALAHSGLQALSSRISRNLCNLEHLKLNFGRCTDVTSDEVRQFSYEISHLLELKSFETEFAALFSNKGNIFRHQSSRTWIPRHLKNLRALSLSFSAGKTGDDGIEALASSISRNQPRLQALSLSFYNEKITEKGLQILSSKICSHFPNLKSFQFSFGSNEITKEDFKVFVSNLAEKLSNLRVLNMDFFFCDIEEETVLAMGKAITNHLTKLEALEITCPNCEMTDEGLKLVFGGETNRLESLKSLKLNFTNLTKISAEGIENVLFCMNKQFPNLANLEFGLGGSKLSDGCLQVISNEIKTNFVNLRQLHLLLWGCTDTTRMGLEELVIALFEKRNDFIECRLNLKNSEGFTEECKGKVIEILKSTDNIFLE